MSRSDEVSRVRSRAMTDASPERDERHIEYVPLDDIPSALVNPKLHDPDLIESSMARFGFMEIPVIDERTGRLVAGHGRRDQLLAMRDGGVSAPEGVKVADDGTWLVPTVRGWASIDDDDAHAAGVALNRGAEAGGWDDRALTELLRDINENDPDNGLIGTGYDPMVLANLLMVTRTAAEIEGFNEAAEWVGMPDYTPEVIPWKLMVSFDTQELRNEFIDRFGIREHITFTHGHARTVSARYPVLADPLNDAGLRWEGDDAADPLGLGPWGSTSEQPGGGSESDPDGSQEGQGEPPPPTALDPSSGSLRAGGPDPLLREGEGDAAGEDPPSGLDADGDEQRAAAAS